MMHMSFKKLLVLIVQSRFLDSQDRNFDMQCTKKWFINVKINVRNHMIYYF